MKLKKLTASEVEFHVHHEQDDVPYAGSFEKESGGPDLEVEKMISDRLDRGDTWAWAAATVVATWKGFTGVACLGGCCYENEEEFRAENFDHMSREALDDLNQVIERQFVKIAELL